MSEPVDPHEGRDQLRRLIDAAPPVTADEARAIAASDPTLGALAAIDAEDGGSGRRRLTPVLLAAAAALLVLVGAAPLVWPDGDEDTDVATGPPTSTAPGPAATVLAPVGDDPLVSCDPTDGGWYRVSAWSNPVGAENADDPVSTALRNGLTLKSALETANSVEPLVPGLPTDTWRRLAETDTEVLFGAGELDLDQVALDELGPMVSIAKVELTDGTWRLAEQHGGSCNDLWVHPGEGHSVARWWIADEDLPLPSDTTELPVSIPSWAMPCGPSVSAEDVLGPDVVETDTTVTVRIAYAVPQIDASDNGACDMGGVGDHADDPPIIVNVQLAAPLGGRAILDGNRYPAPTIRREPQPKRQEPSSPP
ncbi:MAG: hypothetical protein MUF83_16860 [Acidimicrobiales bacterium]|jgi:hypothetical protein|nr:hypothetical protein [Acidimicrobiales bacterium]